MNCRRTMILTVFFCFVAYLGISAFVAYRLTKGARNTDVQWQFSERASKAIIVKPFEVRASHLDGYLRGDIISQKGGSGAGGVVVFIHGYGGNRRLKGRLDPLVQKLAFNELTIVAFDLSGQGISDGSQITMGRNEILDAQTILEFVKKNYPCQPITLIGYSMGGTIALHLFKDPAVSGVVADSSFLSLKPFLDRNLPFWSHLPGFAFTPMILKWIQYFGVQFDLLRITEENLKGQKPLLLIHGKKDAQIPWEESQNIFNMKTEKDKLWSWYPEHADHIDAVVIVQEEYFERTLNFLKEVNSLFSAKCDGSK